MIPKYEIPELYVTATIDVLTWVRRNARLRWAFVENGQLPKMVADGIKEALTGEERVDVYLLLVDTYKALQKALRALHGGGTAHRDAVATLVGKLVTYAIASRMPQSMVLLDEDMYMRILADLAANFKHLPFYMEEMHRGYSAEHEDIVRSQAADVLYLVQGSQGVLSTYIFGNGYSASPEPLQSLYQLGCEYAVNLLCNLPELN